MTAARWACYILSGLLMLVAGGLIILLENKSIGIFAALIGAVMARVLSINVAERFDPARTGPSERAGRETDSTRSNQDEISP